MTLATLKEVLQPALSGGYAVAGLVTLGWGGGRRSRKPAGDFAGWPLLPGAYAPTDFGKNVPSFGRNGCGARGGAS